jgi:hypothetical protein
METSRVRICDNNRHCTALAFFRAFGRKKRPRSEASERMGSPARHSCQLHTAMNRLCEDGVDADELPNGRGEFGWNPANPIPCNTVLGSTVYLSRLRTPDGAKVVYKRAGSIASEVSPHPVDAYQISHPDGRKLGPIFTSAYQKRNSNKSPSGLKLAAEAFI